MAEHADTKHAMQIGARRTETRSESRPADTRGRVVDLDTELNTSLHDVLDLMAREVERLQNNLEYFRLSNHPQKEQLIRELVSEIDERHDRMDQLKGMLLADTDASEH